MESRIFLCSLPWLVHMTKKEVAGLQKAFQFHSILDDAKICFQIENRLLWFAPPASKAGDDGGSSSFDHTQMDLKVALLLPTKSAGKEEAKVDGEGPGEDETKLVTSETRKRRRGVTEEMEGEESPGVLLIIGGLYYLFDHTSIKSVSIPRRVEVDRSKDAMMKDEPYSLFFSLKDVAMRWYMSPVKLAGSSHGDGGGAREEHLQALVEAIRLMNNYLKSSVLGTTTATKVLLPTTKKVVLPVDSIGGPDFGNDLEGSAGLSGDIAGSAGMDSSGSGSGGIGDEEKERQCAARLATASFGMIAATNGAAEALSAPLDPSKVASALISTSSNSSSKTGADATNGGERGLEHIERMAGKYAQLPRYLRALRDKPLAMSTSSTAPVGGARNGDEEVVPCMLSVAEAAHLEATYSVLIERCRTDMENALNGHFGGSSGSVPSSQSQSQNSSGSAAIAVASSGGDNAGITKDGAFIAHQQQQHQQGGGPQRPGQQPEEAVHTIRVGLELRRFARLTQEAALLRSLPRTAYFYEDA